MNTLRLIAVAILALCIAPFARSQSNVEQEVGGTLDAWHTAAAESRFDDYFDLLTEDAIFVGTDATEHWNKQQFMDYAREPFAQGNGWDMKPSNRRTRLSDDNKTAWVVERLHHARMGELRGSGVLVDTDAGWRISQYVLSIPVPNDIAGDVIQLVEQHVRLGAFLGRWRGAVICDGGQIEFEFHVALRDGTLTAQIETPTALDVFQPQPIERVELNDGDLILAFDEYDSIITARLDEPSGKLYGTWTKTRGQDNTAEMRFMASREQWMRHETRVTFDVPELESRYRASFASDDDIAILEISTHNSPAFGTIRTTTGDYGHLYGWFDGRDLALSTFDGAHAFLFTATQQPDGSLKGDFWSGNWWHETWTAVPDDAATLKDPWRMTTWNPATNLAELAYPNLDGHARTLADPEFAGKCKIIEVFGTWCPNCMDATRELKRLRNKYGAQGLSVLALAFEVTGDAARDSAQVQRYVELTNINYPVLLAGTSKKSESSKAFPAIDKIRSYPTFIFLDARDRVRGIYTGFSGPATGEHFATQQSEFEYLIESILAED